MYNRSISFKYYFEMTLLQTKNLKSMKYYGILRRYKWYMPKYCNFMRYLCDAA